MKSSLYILVGILVLSGCRGNNPHHGLYNALFYDYDARLAKLDENLSIQKMKENNLTLERVKISIAYREKTGKLSLLEADLNEVNKELIEINEILNGIAFDKKLSKIKIIVLRIKEEINNKKVVQFYYAEQRKKLNQNIEKVIEGIDKKDKKEVVRLVRKTILDVKKLI